jgi:oxygen-independent coproporphyrinogen-3 oxidase
MNTKYNEFIMTRLRTSGGFLLKDLERMFGISKRYYCLKNAAKSLRSGFLVYEDQSLKLDEKGLFVADSILSDLIWA